MKKFYICLNGIPPFSINKMYYANRKVKTREAREWSILITENLKLEENQSSLQKFRKHFDKSKHCVKVSIRFFYPSFLVLTKENQISTKAHDLSNIEKPLIDLVFLKNREVQNLEIDDKYIVELNSIKGTSDKNYKIEIEIEIVPIEAILKAD